MKRFLHGRAALASIVLVLSLSLAACSSANDGGTASTSDAAASDNAHAKAAATSKAAYDQAAPLESQAGGDGAQEQPAANAADKSLKGDPAGIAADGAAVSAAETDAAGYDRKIVYRASLTMEVKDFDSATIALQNVLHQSGGYILKFSDSKNDAETGATYTLKVPSSGFMPFLDRLEKIDHNLFQRQLQGTDVSEEYVDLEARLKAKQVVETRLLAFMDKATKANDLLQFSGQLASVQGEIEQIKGRMRYLDQNVAFSTIELRMYQPAAGAPAAAAGKREPLGARMGHALQASAAGIGDMLQALLVFAAGALPVLLLLAVAALPFVWLARRSLLSRPVKPLVQGAVPAGSPDNNTNADD